MYISILYNELAFIFLSLESLVATSQVAYGHTRSVFVPVCVCDSVRIHWTGIQTCDHVWK